MIVVQRLAARNPMEAVVYQILIVARYLFMQLKKLSPMLIHLIEILLQTPANDLQKHTASLLNYIHLVTLRVNALDKVAKRRELLQKGVNFLIHAGQHILAHLGNFLHKIKYLVDHESEVPALEKFLRDLG